ARNPTIRSPNGPHGTWKRLAGPFGRDPPKWCLKSTRDLQPRHLLQTRAYNQIRIEPSRSTRGRAIEWFPFSADKRKWCRFVPVVPKVPGKRSAPRRVDPSPSHRCALWRSDNAGPGVFPGVIRQLRELIDRFEQESRGGCPDGCSRRPQRRCLHLRQPCDWGVLAGRRASGNHNEASISSHREIDGSKRGRGIRGGKTPCKRVGFPLFRTVRFVIA